MAQLVGVVLAGGLGRRMGQAKGALETGGQRLAERAARTLFPLTGSVVISVAPGCPWQFEGFPLVEDEKTSGKGPLAGLAAAFHVSGVADLLVLACDYPAVQTTELKSLLVQARADADLVMPVDPRGVDHPLVGLWRRTARPAIDEALEENRLRVRSVLSDLEVQRVHAASELVNLNTPEDLNEYLAQLESFSSTRPSASQNRPTDGTFTRSSGE